MWNMPAQGQQGQIFGKLLKYVTKHIVFFINSKVDLLQARNLAELFPKT